MNGFYTIAPLQNQCGHKNCSVDAKFMIVTDMSIHDQRTVLFTCAVHTLTSTAILERIGLKEIKVHEVNDQ